MKISTISINGFKALQQFSIAPDGASIEISGDNGVGKSSVIDAIWMTLTGKEVPGVPVHRDMVKAAISLGLDDGTTVEWECKAGSKKLTVTGPDGEPVKEPRTFLNNLIGNISFDPFGFVDEQPAKQKEILQKQILKLDFTDLDAAKSGKLAIHRDAKASADAIERQIQGMGAVTRTVPVDVRELQLAQEAREAVKRRLAGAEGDRRAIDTAIAQNKDAVVQVDREIEDLEARIAAAKVRREGIEAKLHGCAQDVLAAESKIADLVAELNEMPDNSEAIAKASETNLAASRWEDYQRLQAQWGKELEKVETAKLEIEALDRLRVQRLAEAEFPVPGLSFSEAGVLYNGLPFDRLNQCMSDILKVGTAIAVSLKPNLKIVRIKDGSLLGKTKKEELLTMLSKLGFQAFLETVTEGPLAAAVIEEA